MRNFEKFLKKGVKPESFTEALFNFFSLREDVEFTDVVVNSADVNYFLNSECKAELRDFEKDILRGANDFININGTKYVKRERKDVDQDKLTVIYRSLSGPPKEVVYYWDRTKFNYFDGLEYDKEYDLQELINIEGNMEIWK